ncbi:MAG: phage virion morphogenesis protein [Oscillospiraceae bacterium]|nr:phage virion morphogenesis protein [Oscillospiraceae bacterium]
MYSISLEGDAQRMRRKMQRIADLDKKKLNRLLAEDTRDATLERFKTGKGPDGKTWKTSIRASSEGGKTLVKTAQLRNSIQSSSDKSGFAVGTNVKHAATHQFGEPGRTIRAKKAKSLRFQTGGNWVSKKEVRIKIPARPYLGFSDDDQGTMKHTIEDFLQKED